MATPTQQPVDAPLAGPPRFGLVAAANVLRDALRWEGGYIFQPEALSGAGVQDPCDVVDFDPPERPANVTGVPFLVWAGDVCSAMGFEAADYQGRARRALEAQESEQIAHEFWVGTQNDASGWGNQQLADQASADVYGESMLPVDALACLEQGLANEQGNRRGMIHCTPQVLSVWAANYFIRREGNLWLTPLDHIVVADAGYDGSGPDGQPATDGNIWAYATGLVTLRLSEVAVVPGDFAQALDRAVNTVTYRAERLASPSWDGQAHIAVSLDLALCGAGGS